MSGSGHLPLEGESTSWTPSLDLLYLSNAHWRELKCRESDFELEDRCLRFAMEGGKKMRRHRMRAADSP